VERCGFLEVIRACESMVVCLPKSEPKYYDDITCNLLK
jgi:hypothetical protein